MTFENSGALRKSTVGMTWACCTGSTRSEVNRNWHVDSAGFECSCSRCNLEAEKVLLGPSFCLVGNFCANPKIPKTAKKSALQCRFFATMPRPSKYLEQYIHIYPLWWDCYLFFNHVCGYTLKTSRRCTQPEAAWVGTTLDACARTGSCTGDLPPADFLLRLTPLAAKALNILVSDLSTMRILRYIYIYIHIIECQLYYMLFI